MNEKELLSAISQMMDERFQSMSQMMDEKLEPMKVDINSMKVDINGMKVDINGMKADINSMKADINGINTRLDKMDTDISEIKKRTVKIEIALENEIRPNIQLLMEGHKGLVDNIYEIQKDTSRIEKIETRLFAAEAVAKDNVENIKKLQPKRKI